jgi:RimJ/RimL family protein N-acetyltransferase
MTGTDGAAAAADAESIAVATLPDGRVVRVRPLRRGEEATVEQVFAGLSGESRWLRFLAPMPRLSESLRRQLADVDHVRHGAWVATVDEVPVGLARYVRDARHPEVAEIALSVTDDHHGHGIGRALLAVLGAVAGDAGVTTFLWVTDPANRRIQRLAAPLGGRRQYNDGLAELRTPLPDPSRLDVAALRRLAAHAQRAAAGTGPASAA